MANERAPFFPYAGTDTARDLRRRAGRLLQLSRGLKDPVSLSTLEEDELLEMLRVSENASLGIRKALACRRTLPDRERPPAGAGYVPAEYLPVEAEYAGGILTVSCPPTFLRAMKDSWRLAESVRAVLRFHCEHFGVPRIPQPAVALCIRKAVYYRNGYRDNENFESSRIINTVMECLGYTDRPDHLGYVSLFRKVPDVSLCGVDFVFLPLDLLKRRTDLLDF